MHSGGLEVWTARPAQLGCDGCAELARVLDAGERGRAASLVFEADRRAFVVAHAMRRIALGTALALDPQDVRLGTGAHGQPLLLNEAGAALSFSLSRSRDLVAVALSRDGPVGIDVEPIQAGVDATLLEPYLVLRGGEDDDEERFYAHWTALEAYWKARGLGLSPAHPRIELHELDDDCFEVGSGGRSAGMFVLRLPAPPTHVLSLACAQPGNVRMVELDSLAAMPQRAQPSESMSSCKSGHCVASAAPSMFSS